VAEGNQVLKGELSMSYCSSCGAEIDECNESQPVCGRCGESDCWLTAKPDYLDEIEPFDDQSGLSDDTDLA
jgi:predicted RNA-binding Zn-ribbon protein involved in translation (DUF1610 family)